MKQPKKTQSMEQMLGMRVIHLAKLVDGRGNVSPWCAATPRKINLKRESWTNRAEAANCFVCINAFSESRNEVERSRNVGT